MIVSFLITISIFIIHDRKVYILSCNKDCITQFEGGERMRKEFYLVVVGLLILSIYVPVTAPNGNRVSMIFETDNKQALKNEIIALGGMVTIEYDNVDMLAAEVPISVLESLLSNPHVIKIYKDEMRSLPCPPEKNDDLDLTPREILNLTDYSMETFDITKIEALPDNFYNYMITGAEDIWAETGYGDGTLVAVIDTGTYPQHPLFMWPDGTSSVIGGTCFAPGESEDSWDDPDNHYHGTVVAGIIASHGGIVLPVSDPLAQSIMLYAPDSYIPYGPDQILVPLLGMSPYSDIYAIKVFPKNGSGVPSSVIMQGIDHAITMRKLYDSTNGAEGFPIDVINMSLGGGTGFDGLDPEDKLVDQATLAGIVVVTAAGNDGPALNTVSTPGCALSSIAVGAAADPVHTRVGTDLVYGTVGIGEYFFPYDDIQIIYFSSHGPTSDDRLAPDVLTCGVYTMSAFPPYFIGVMSGTSSASPAAAGGAALLAAWQKMNQGQANPMQIRNAIIEGATPLTKPYSLYAQGNGYMDVPNSLDLLKDGITSIPIIQWGHKLETTDLHGGTQTWSTGTVGPGEAFDLAIYVDKHTEQLDVCLSNVTLSGTQNPLLGDSIEFYIQSSVRTSANYYYESVNIYDDQCFTIHQPDPGNVRIVVEGDWTNWGTVSCDVTVTETKGRKLCKIEGNGIIDQGEWKVHYVEVPEGVGCVKFELWWRSDWSTYPTYDMDMYVIDPNGAIYMDGAQYWSPEAQYIENPVPGTYTVLVLGYEIYLYKNPYWLRVCYMC